MCMRSSLLVVLVSVMVLAVTATVTAQVSAGPAQPEWVKYVDIIVPGVVYLVKTLIWLIVVIGGALFNLIWYLGRKRLAHQKQMDAKIDVMYQVITSCDGCRESMDKVVHGRSAIESGD